MDKDDDVKSVLNSLQKYQWNLSIAVLLVFGKLKERFSNFISLHLIGISREKLSF